MNINNERMKTKSALNVNYLIIKINTFKLEVITYIF